MGFEHSSIAPSSTGFIKKYGIEDSQTGSMSYMGGELANKFHFIPSPSHFRRVVCKRKLYMPWLRSADRGVNTYRLFAWDHPYSRVFLGDDKRKIHQEDDFIDGIMFKYNTMGLSLEYGMKTFNSKFKSLLVGRIGLHYRWYPENQDGYQNKGVIFEIDDFVDNTTTIGNYGVILSASTDDIENKDQSYIPLNYVKIPEVDIGTLKFRVTKFHPIKDVIPHLEQLDRMPENVSIDDLPYVEIEVTNLPKEKYTPPSKKASIPELIFSPNLVGCELIEQEDRYQCFYYDEINYWFYIKQNTGGVESLPRIYIYNSLSLIKDGRLGVISYSGLSNADKNYTIITGSMDQEKKRSTGVIFKKINSKSMQTIITHFHPQCTTKLKNKATGEYEIYKHPDLPLDMYDVAYLYNIYEIAVVRQIVITDLYFNEYSRISTKISKVMIFFLKPLPIQGFQKLYINFLNEDGKILNQSPITRSNNVPENRIAVFNYDLKNGSYSIIPATLKGKKTLSSIMGPINIEKEKWYYFLYNRYEMVDYIFVDFVDSIPKGLVIYFETENGVFEKDLSFMLEFRGQSTRISIIEVAQQTGGWGEIYKYKFNLQVELMSIRPVLLSTSLKQPETINAKDTEYDLSDGDYRFECGMTSGIYQIMNFTYKLNNESYIFTNETQEYVIVFKKDIVDGIIFHSVAALVLLLILAV